MSATAGDTCTKDSECEPNGDCLSAAATEDGWPGGYCIKFGCMLPGRECAGDAVCQERRVGVDLCLAGCEVAAEDDEANADELRLGLAGHNPDCREGYSCVWDGIGAEGVANNGACLPGNYNEVTEANVGTTCTEETSCYSPYGQGVCLNNEFWGDGYCTMFDCNAPGMPTDVCGAGAQCATFVEDVAACFQNCTSADECNDGLGCYDTTMLGITVSAGTKICFPGCLAAADCRTGETCNRPDPMGLGDCVATP